MPVYQYDGKHYSLPDGLTDEQAIAKIKGHLGASGPKQDAGDKFYGDIARGFKGGLAGIGNTVDRAASGLVGGALSTLYGQDDSAASVFDAMHERIKSRNDFAGDQSDLGLLPGMIGKAPLLPSQLLSTPLSPFSTGQEMIDNGETLGKAQAGQAVSDLGNAAAFALPMSLGISTAAKAVTGAGGQMLNTWGTNAAIRAIADKEATKKQFDPTLKDYLESGIIGAGFGLAGPTTTVRNPFKKKPVAPTVDPVISKVEEILAPKPEVTPEAPAPQPQADAMLSTRNQALFDQGRQEFAEFSRHDAAQQVLEARQREMEQQVARQTTLDMNAAERARQEQAPTGYAGWVERQRNDVGGDLGNNEPINWPRKKADRFPEVTTSPMDQGFKYDHGIDFTTVEQKALPVTIADMINEGRKAPSPVEVNPMDRANQILAGTELARKRPAKDPPRRGGKQSGAIDLKALEEGFERFKVLPDGTKLKAFAEGDGALHVAAYDKDGNFIGRVSASSENWANPKASDNLKADWTESSRKGTATEMYKYLAELGNDIVPSKSQTAAGRGMWEGFERKGLASNGMIRRQRGGFDYEILPKSFRDFVDRWVGAGGNLSHVGVSYMLDDHPVTLSKTQRELLASLYPETAKTYQDKIDRAWQQNDPAKAARFGKRYDDALIQEAVLKHHDAFGKGFKLDGQTYNAKTGFWAGKVAAREQAEAIINSAKRKQSGQLNFKGISEEIERAVKAVGNQVGKALSSRTDADKVLGMAVRDDSFVARPLSGEDIVAKALQEDPTKFGRFSDNVQSGAVSAGDKFGSSVLQQTGRWMNWASSMTKKLVREHVVPVERMFSRLNETDLSHAMQIAMREDMANTRLTPEQLSEAGVSPKAIAALGAMRKEMDAAFARVNAMNKDLGRPEVSRREAYFSSQFSGDYKIPVLSKDGKKVLGFATAHSMKEAKQALAWIKENMPEAQAQIVDRRDSSMGRAPKDVTNLYQTLMDVFKDTPMGAELQQLMEQHKEVQGYAERGFWKHFEEKSGVRFFIGDRPWLSAKENATQAAHSQVRYLKDVYNWIPTQEMMVEMKKVLSNEELAKKQPDAIRLANAYVDNYLGVTQNKLKLVEDSVAKAMGMSTGQMRSIMAGMKTMTYWMQLGFSGGYAIATPLQMLIHAPGFHLQMSNQGMAHSIMGNMFKSLRDANYAFQIDLGHKLGDAIGRELNWSKSDREFANAAIRYMEDNGVNNKSLRDEYASLGSHPGMDAAGKLIDKTITGPDYASRTVAFFSFAHHIRDGAPSMPLMEVFRKAAELTDKSAVPLERHNRPLAFDKIGLLGEMTSMYKAPVFQYWNNMYEFASTGKRTGNWKPLIASLMAGTLLGGVNGIGGFSEADSLFELLKDINAKVGSKSAAVAAKDVSLKTMALTHLGEFGTYGALSSLTNTAMASRFSPQGFDFQKPWNVASPIIQEAVEWGSAGKALGHNVESLTDHGKFDLPSIQQAAYDAISPPAVKGLMENHLDNFHGKQQPNGKTPAYKASDMRNKEVMYERTKGDQMRRNFGLYSLDESKTKEVRARVDQNNQRMKVVRDRLIKDIASEILRGDNPQSNLDLFVKAKGEITELETGVQYRLAKADLSPQKRELLRANLLRDFDAIMEKQKLGVNYAN